MGKEGFIAFLNKTKTSKYYIPFNIRLSCIFSAIYKTCLCYLCYERLYYLNKRRKRKEIVFRRIMSRKWLSELWKCASDGTFHPYRRVKREGQRKVGEGLKSYFLEHILHYSQEWEEGKREQEERQSPLSPPYRNIKQTIKRINNST